MIWLRSLRLIKYEHNSLVLDSSHTKQDQKAVNDFFEHAIASERIRIWNEIEKLYERSHSSRTPIYQDDMYKYLNSIINSGGKFGGV